MRAASTLQAGWGAPEGCFQILYVSRAVQGFSPSDLLDLLQLSRRNNARQGITGLLMHRQQVFLQLLEGPRPAVEFLLARLRTDSRHTDLTILAERQVQARYFPDWAMGFEEVDQVIPSTWPGLSAALPPAWSVPQWAEEAEQAVAFFEACRRPIPS
jgi:hypothetical protein